MLFPWSNHHVQAIAHRSAPASVRTTEEAVAWSADLVRQGTEARVVSVQDLTGMVTRGGGSEWARAAKATQEAAIAHREAADILYSVLAQLDSAWQGSGADAAGRQRPEVRADRRDDRVDVRPQLPQHHRGRPGVPEPEDPAGSLGAAAGEEPVRQPVVLGHRHREGDHGLQREGGAVPGALPRLRHPPGRPGSRSPARLGHGGTRRRHDVLGSRGPKSAGHQRGIGIGRRRDADRPSARRAGTGRAAGRGHPQLGAAPVPSGADSRIAAGPPSLAGASSSGTTSTTGYVATGTPASPMAPQWPGGGPAASAPSPSGPTVPGVGGNFRGNLPGGPAGAPRGGSSGVREGTRGGGRPSSPGSTAPGTRSRREDDRVHERKYVLDDGSLFSDDERHARVDPETGLTTVDPTIGA